MRVDWGSNGDWSIKARPRWLFLFLHYGVAHYLRPLICRWKGHTPVPSSARPFDQFYLCRRCYRNISKPYDV